MDFVREMANSIKTIWTEGDYLWKYVNPDRFKGNVFEPPQDSTVGVLNRLARNIKSKLTFSLAVVAIFTNPVQVAGLNDFVWLFALLAKNRVYLRDIKVVRDIESILTAKKYELGAGGGRYTKINPENKKIMNAIIKKYVDKWLLTSSSQVNEGALYNNISAALNQLIAASKRFVYLNQVWWFQDIGRWTYSTFWEDGVTIQFTPEALKVMYADYECVRWVNNPCDSSRKKFAKDMKDLRKGTKDWRWKSLDTLTRSTRALQNTLSDLKDKTQKDKTQKKQAEARENDLVRAMYGSQKLGEGTLRRRLTNFNITQNNGNISLADIQKWASDFSSWVVKLVKWTLAKKTLNEKKAEIETAISTKWWYDISNAFIAIMSEYTSDVFASQALDMQIVTFSEVKADTTKNFTLLGQQIYAIKDGILGGKDQNNSLIRSLWNACETQCILNRWACR